MVVVNGVLLVVQRISRGSGVSQLNGYDVRIVTVLTGGEAPQFGGVTATSVA
jgi:hypothetical protein